MTAFSLMILGTLCTIHIHIYITSCILVTRSSYFNFGAFQDLPPNEKPPPFFLFLLVCYICTTTTTKHGHGGMKNKDSVCKTTYKSFRGALSKLGRFRPTCQKFLSDHCLCQDENVLLKCNMYKFMIYCASCHPPKNPMNATEGFR